jgi:hypothetical protein
LQVFDFGLTVELFAEALDAILIGSSIGSLFEIVKE